MEKKQQSDIKNALENKWVSTSSFQIAQDRLLSANGLTVSSLQGVLDYLLSHQIDMADLYFQSLQSEAFLLDDGIVKEVGSHEESGVGVRAISGEKVGFAFANDIHIDALMRSAEAARAIAVLGGHLHCQAFKEVNYIPHYNPLNPFNTFSPEDKVALLRRIDNEARAQDPRVIQVIAGLNGVYEVIFIMASDGTLAADIRPLVQFSIRVIVEQNGRREMGVCAGGERGNYDCFLKTSVASEYVREAVRQAVVNLKAIQAPAGTMPVILAAGWPGILLHEAVGHGLEGDFNRKKTSAFSDCMGKRVASSLCTIIDDGTLSRKRGSLNIDDEGTPTQSTILIEKGILKGYLQDKLNSRLMGTSSTGNGRRDSYASVPLPRMTNTYMLPGDHDPQEIIQSVDKGLYAVNFSGGEVDITSGKFVFSSSEAYLIEQGKITSPVKGATLIGNGPDILTKVSMVGNDLAFDAGYGLCGKAGQSVPVGVGQPTLKIDELTVGGS
jgi:TldD protein